MIQVKLDGLHAPWSSVLCTAAHRNISSLHVCGNHKYRFEDLCRDLCVYQWRKTVQSESTLLLVMAVSAPLITASMTVSVSCLASNLAGHQGVDDHMRRNRCRAVLLPEQSKCVGAHVITVGNVGSVAVTFVCGSAAGAGALLCLLQRRGCKGSARGK